MKRLREKAPTAALQPSCAAWIWAGLLAAALPAAAALGDEAASTQSDALRLRAARHFAGHAQGTVHTLSLADGSTIRQFVGSDGRVYALAWNTRAKPRLDQLLGRYFDAYAAAASAAQQHRAGARHHAVLGDGDLVVESGAHLHAHVGRAYLRSRLPAGASLDAIR